MNNLFTRRAFLALVAVGACGRPAAAADPVEQFRALSREICGVPLESLPYERADQILAELGPVPLAPAWDETWFLDRAEQIANAWYAGWDGLAWSCPRGVQAPGGCGQGQWWLTPR